MHNYNLKKVFKEETLPELSNLIIEELKEYGEVLFLKRTDGDFQLSIISKNEITDFEPIKLIILNHKVLDCIKKDKIKQLKENARNLFNKKYDVLDVALCIVKDNGRKADLEIDLDLLTQAVKDKIIEINSKQKISTLQLVDISLSGIGV